jgi:excisionase family DNA binding protein
MGRAKKRIDHNEALERLAICTPSPHFAKHVDPIIVDFLSDSLTVSQAAWVLGCSRRTTVRRLREAGVAPWHVGFGNGQTVRFQRTTLAQALQQCLI